MSRIAWLISARACGWLTLLSITFAAADCANAQRNARTPVGPPTLGLTNGFIDLETPDFNLQLVRDSQTIAALKPKAAKDGFDFTPNDQLQARAANGFYHLGDLTLRVRTNGAADWQSYSTATARKPVETIPASGSILASADLEPTLSLDCPFQIIRTWELDNGKLVLRFSLKNKTAGPLEIGAFGIPMIFNNYITGRSLAQAHAICSFSDPAICMDAGYIQVTRLSGHGPALLVVEDGKTPLEAYNPLLNDRTRREQTFEGFYEWMVHSLAYATNEWKSAQPWNTPTSETIAPGATRTFGVKFLIAPEIPAIEKTLAHNGRPVAVGIPGYVLPMDMDAHLFLNYPQTVKSLEVEPAGAISISKNKPTASGWKSYTLRGKTWGRSRLTITYGNGLAQTICYDVIKPEAQTVADLGNFLFTKQWFVEPSDPFHRSPSIMTFDRSKNQFVLQDSRVWFAGLEDEAGAGSWIAATMKEFGQPKREELDKLQQFIDGVLWGGLQYSEGPMKYGVRKSLFYYQPDQMPTNFYRKDFNWTSWTSWNKHDSERIDRAYNYPHVVCAYWTMYRLARNNPGLVTNHPWDWYLDHAYQTVKFLTGRNSNGEYNVGYIDVGLMDGDIFVMLLNDLKREGWNDQAADVEKEMKARADLWKTQAYPFGSEMAWDSTGQEEVFAWTKYFGYDEKGQVSLDSILGYMPTVPHWGYNGNARRYWDFIYGAAPGPTSRIERQIHHYGSGINSIPVLAAYREHPDDLYLLRVGYGGTMGALTGIDQEGFASAAFHAWPSTLRWDYYSGDYGPNFFGHAVDTGTYVLNHPDFGWIAFGGAVKARGKSVTITPLDSFRRRVFLAPLGLWLTLDAGQFESVQMNLQSHLVRVTFAKADAYTPEARLRIEQPARPDGIGSFQPVAGFKTEREAFVVPLKPSTTLIELTDKRAAGK